MCYEDKIKELTELIARKVPQAYRSIQDAERLAGWWRLPSTEGIVIRFMSIIDDMEENAELYGLSIVLKSIGTNPETPRSALREAYTQHLREVCESQRLVTYGLVN